jgi:glycosyltransferase involved in cell wall biosynthesis
VKKIKRTKTTEGLKVLQVLPRVNSGGVERGTIDVAYFMNKLQPHTCMIASAGGSLETDIARKKIKHITLPLDSKNPFIILLNSLRLYKVIKDNQINIVHARSRAPAWSAYLAARRANVAFVTTVHGAYNPDGFLKKKYNSIMLKGDKVIAVSNFIEKYIRKNYVLFRNNIEVIYRGVDLQSFTPENVSESRVEVLFQHYRLPLEKCIILLPGRLSRIKGHEVLLDALAELKSEDWICLFVGPMNDENQEYIKELYDHATQLKIRHRLYVYNECTDMPALYKMCNIVICPTIIPEAFGRVIAEAMAMERPVIASDHGGAKEIIENEVSGFLFDNKNPKDLARIIERVMKITPRNRSKLQMQAHTRIKTYFDNKTMLEKTLKIYKKLFSL